MSTAYSNAHDLRVKTRAQMVVCTPDLEAVMKDRPYTTAGGSGGDSQTVSRRGLISFVEYVVM